MSLTVKLADEVDAKTAHAALNGLSAPASEADINEWLTICAVKTAHAKDDEMTSDLKLRVYATDLAAYPGDVVRHVLKEWPNNNKWFPVWQELCAEIERMAGLRPQIVERVRIKLGNRTGAGQ